MSREFDLERRTTEFAKAVINICKVIPRNPINDRLVGQLVGASGSVGANYREANDSLGKKDFIHRLKISRREAKESLHWLECVLEANKNKETDIAPLMKEAGELKNILSSIILKSE
ncbi:MAG: four helix bundle protein [Candidatus Omnitrophota bacterium]